MANCRQQFIDLMTTMGATLDESYSEHSGYELYKYRGVPIAITPMGIMYVYRSEMVCAKQDGNSLYTFTCGEVENGYVQAIIEDTATFINM
jgi:hypothetical protein